MPVRMDLVRGLPSAALMAVLAVGNIACAGSASPANSTAGDSTPSSDEPASSQGGEESAQAQHRALAPLRPDGAQAVLGPLEGGPPDADALARAAVFYADTDAAGMTLLWGLAHGAMRGGSDPDPDVASAIVQVLDERIKVSQQDGKTNVSTKLAPGAVPVIQRDGEQLAPVAHLFEQFFAPTLGPAVVDGWSREDYVQALAGFVQFQHGKSTFLDEHIEVLSWLGRLHEAGHLEAFFVLLLGAALPDALAAYEQTHADGLAAARSYLTSHPFRPSRAVLPDDLVPLRE